MGKNARNPGGFKSFQKSFYPSSGTKSKVKQPKKKTVRLDADSSMPEPSNQGIGQKIATKVSFILSEPALLILIQILE